MNNGEFLTEEKLVGCFSSKLQKNRMSSFDNEKKNSYKIERFLHRFSSSSSYSHY